MTQNVNPDPVPTPTPAGGAPPGTSPLNFAVGPTAAYEGPPPDQDGKTMGMLAHLLGIFTGWVGPLVIWLVKRDTSPFVNDQGKEALNWEITVFIGGFVLGILWFLVIILSHVAHFLGFLICLLYPLFGLLWIVNLIFCIMGTMSANKGIAYRYPFSLRLIK